MKLKEAGLGEELLSLPHGPAGPSRPGKGGRAPTTPEIEAALTAAWASLEAGAAAGNGPRTAAIALQPADAAGRIARLAETIAGDLASPGAEAPAQPGEPGAAGDLADALYDRAGTALAAGDVAEAVVLLGLMMHGPHAEAEAMLGLAVCAVRLGRYGEAETLAAEHLRREAPHPRAYCIAGLCEMKRGERRAAQNMLAAAARLARHRPEFRDELRAAQRLLIVMHLS